MRIVGALLRAVVALAISCSSAQAGPILTQFELRSEPGDFVGQGQSYFRDLTTGDFDIVQAFDRQGDGLVDSVFLRYLGNVLGTFAHISFETTQLPGINLRPGFYSDAERAPFAGPGHPGLDWGLDGRGCNTLTGSFTILGAQFDYVGATPSLLSFGATFEQHCENAAPALFGTFYYNFDPDTAVPEPASTLSLLVLGFCGVLGCARWMKQSARMAPSGRSRPEVGDRGVGSRRLQRQRVLSLPRHGFQSPTGVRMSDRVGGLLRPDA